MTDEVAPPALSEAELRASASRTAPASEDAGRGISTVALPLPPGPNVPYTLAYLVADGDGAPHLVDTGWDSPDNLDRVERHLAERGWRLSDLSSIVVTHLHSDHLGMAAALRERTGAPVLLSRAEQASIDALVGSAPTWVERARERAGGWGVPADRVPELLEVAERAAHVTPFRADALVDDGDTLPIPGRSLRAVVTPGHTPGSLCLVDDLDDLDGSGGSGGSGGPGGPGGPGVVFTGDHVLPTVYSGLGLGGSSPRNALTAMLDSLSRIAQYDALDVLPGHEYRFRGLADRCARIARHHLRRSEEVARARDTLADPTVFEIASRVSWSPGWENMRGFVLQSALQQTAMHLEHLMEEDR
ncbi:MBL fold metallo-hydrolase [Humibacter sp. BT305]|nr:MBL fold metallo-hydrolase [Humibacter sp. BT305]